MEGNIMKMKRTEHEVIVEHNGEICPMIFTEEFDKKIAKYLVMCKDAIKEGNKTKIKKAANWAYYRLADTIIEEYDSVEGRSYGRVSRSNSKIERLLNICRDHASIYSKELGGMVLEWYREGDYDYTEFIDVINCEIAGKGRIGENMHMTNIELIENIRQDYEMSTTPEMSIDDDDDLTPECCGVTESLVKRTTRKKKDLDVHLL